MIKKIQLVVCSSVLTLISLSAFAVNSGFYLGGQISYNAVDLGLVTAGYDNLGGGLLLGYNFRSTDRVLLGFELASNYLGKFKDSSANMWAGSLLLTGTYDIAPQVDGFVKVGIVREMVANNNGDFSGHSDIAPTLGVGFAYNLTNHLDFTMQYTHIFGDSVAKVIVNRSNTAFTYDNVLVGLTYNFGAGKYEPAHTYQVQKPRSRRAYADNVYQTQDDA